MNKINKSMIMAILAIMVISNGCLSPMVYNQSKQIVKARRGDASILDVITEQPIKLGAAVVADIGICYIGYRGAKYLDEELEASE